MTPETLTCTCPGFTYRLTDCKHIRVIKRLQAKASGTFAFPLTITSWSDPRKRYVIDTLRTRATGQEQGK